MDLVPTTLGEFFTFVGSSAAIGFVLSWIAGNWGFFQRATSQGKAAILVFISLLMGLGSFALVRFVPAGVIEQAQPYYQVIISSITILIASQAWHKWIDPADKTADTAAKTLNDLLGKG